MRSDWTQAPTWAPTRGRRPEEDLADLISHITPLRRTLDPAAIRRNGQSDAAIKALHAVGAIDDEAQSRSRAELPRAQAPWLPEGISPPPLNTMDSFAICVPPENTEQAAQDAAATAALDARPHAAEIQRAIVGSAKQHNDLAIVAIVLHEDATAVHIHYLGESPDRRTIKTTSPPGTNYLTGYGRRSCATTPARSISQSATDPTQRPEQAASQTQNGVTRSRALAVHPRNPTPRTELHRPPTWP